MRLSTKLYRDASTDKVYRWTGSVYVETVDYAPVRLVAQTAVLGLTVDMTLCYTFSFDHVTFDGKDQSLPPFTVAAATTDVIVDLATAPRIDPLWKP